MGATRTAAILAALVAAAGCGGGTPRHARAAPSPTPPAPLPPDAGTQTGHGTRRVVVPQHDRTPPLALLRLYTGAASRPAVVEHSPVRSQDGPVVELARPSLRLTGIARDADGGTGRIRVSVEYWIACLGRPDRMVTLYFPPPQIAQVRIAPGMLAPAVRTRTVTVRLRTGGAGCSVSGKTWAEATDAQGLEEFSTPLHFSWGPRAAETPAPGR
jgi:hypothetical protein